MMHGLGRCGWQVSASVGPQILSMRVLVAQSIPNLDQGCASCAERAQVGVHRRTDVHMHVCKLLTLPRHFLTLFQSTKVSRSLLHPWPHKVRLTAQV